MDSSSFAVSFRRFVAFDILMSHISRTTDLPSTALKSFSSRRVEQPTLRAMAATEMADLSSLRMMSLARKVHA